MSRTIRQANHTDVETIVRFNQAMARETEGKQLDTEVLRRGVAAGVADSHKGIYWLAEVEGNVHAQAFVTYEWSDWRNGWFWWIQSVYVEPAVRRQGLFRELFAHIRYEAMQQSDVIGIRLYVETENDVAQAAYLDLGMVLEPYNMMMIPLIRESASGLSSPSE